MARSHAVVRDAQLRDLPVLTELWVDLLRSGEGVGDSDLQTLIDDAPHDDSLRVLVAEVDGDAVGAVLLRIAAMSPLNPDLMVHAFAPQVAADARRRGVGSALMEAAVAFAEERGVGFVGAAAFASSRDANRFFARLGLGPRAVLRVATTGSVRQRLSSVRPARTHERRHVERVLAARRGRRGARISA